MNVLCMMPTIKDLLPLNDFEHALYDAAHANLADTANKLRVNNFAYAIRSLLDVFVKRLAPDAYVLHCGWYENTSSPVIDRHVSNKQRYMYLLRSSIPNDEVEELELSDLLADTIKTMQSYWKELSDLTHVTEGTFGISPQEQDAFIAKTEEILTSFCQTYSDVRKAVLQKVKEEHVTDAVIQAFIAEYIGGLGEISGRYSVGCVYVEDVTVQDIQYEEVTIAVSGTVDVEFSWGKGDDEASIDDNFPFQGQCTCSVGDWNNITAVDETFGVDNSGWFKDWCDPEEEEAA